ncbi:uncharacterized protein LOC121235443 [Juglans microcarpa x Juglans regia]|uniref:uncharacterized protein LOC121235443 n=1 Tax=Juglans microcarpa x Juglans regia TaxID=2249226 RepID=UPI001B7D95B8|nr:uncharacterized protein LOC121235443 [Juglans microcarpa x Juglans regia]
MATELKVQRQLNKKDLDVLNDLNLEIPRIITRKCMLVKWSKPPSGWIKLNCNGSCPNNPGSSEGGGILRDMDGNFKVAFSAHFGLGTNNKAELRAILEGIRLCKSLYFSKIIIESDSKLIVDWFRLLNEEDFLKAMSREGTEIDGHNSKICHWRDGGKKEKERLKAEGKMVMQIWCPQNPDEGERKNVVESEVSPNSVPGNIIGVENLGACSSPMEVVMVQET